MQVGLIGVGRMGAGIMRRWQAAQHKVFAFDRNPRLQATVEETGGTWAASFKDLVAVLVAPRVIWLMVPSANRRADEAAATGPVDTVLRTLIDLLQGGDTVIDGGNSYFVDSQARAKELAAKKINFIDVGVSGGMAGAKHGYALMIGAEQPVKNLQPLFTALARRSSAGNVACDYVGPVGAGHFVKMVHNAIEYGMMQSMAEGFDLLKNGPYAKLDIARIAALWSQGTIIRSYLMETAAVALQENNDLAQIAAEVDDSGEGRWSVETAVRHAVPFWANTVALYARFASRQSDSFAHKILAALRREFGGHSVKKN